MPKNTFFLSDLIHRWKRRQFNRIYGQNTAMKIRDWAKNPENYFFASRGQQIKWGNPSTSADCFPRGFCLMPDCTAYYPHPDYGLKIGYVQKIQMYRGLVKIGHIGLNIDLTRQELQVGKHFLAGILNLMRSLDATEVQFHEDHSTKIEHYRRFFEKCGIPEHPPGVWTVDLYPDGNVPDDVRRRLYALETIA